MYNIMQNLQIFNFQDYSIRTLLIKNEPFFCAKDVCIVLEISNPSQALKKIDKDDVILNEVADSLGRMQKTSFVNESGLYELIFSSRKKEATDFKKFVYKKILPEIRKTGSFNVKQEQKQLPTNYKEALQQLLISVENNEKLQAKTIQQEKTINLISDTKDLYTFRHLSQKVNIKEGILRLILQSVKIIHKKESSTAKKYFPSAEAIKKEYAVYKTKIIRLETREGNFIEKSIEEVLFTQKLCEKILKNRERLLDSIKNSL